MKVSSSRNDSSRVSRSNGPLPASVPQTAKPASTSVDVAVSRGPRRSADHNSGSTARKPSGARRSAVAKIGLNAIKPIAQATQKMTIDSNSLRPLILRISAAAHKHDHRRHQQRTGEVAEPPGQPERAQHRAVDQAADRQAGHADGRADRGRHERQQREAGDAGRGVEGRLAVREPRDQVGAQQPFDRVAGADRQRRGDRPGDGQVGGEGRDQDRRPDPEPAQQDRREGNPGRRPDRRHARIDRRELQPDLRERKIDQRR